MSEIPANFTSQRKSSQWKKATQPCKDASGKQSLTPITPGNSLLHITVGMVPMNGEVPFMKQGKKKEG